MNGVRLSVHEERLIGILQHEVIGNPRVVRCGEIDLLSKERLELKVDGVHTSDISVVVKAIQIAAVKLGFRNKEWVRQDCVSQKTHELDCFYLDCTLLNALLPQALRARARVIKGVQEAELPSQVFTNLFEVSKKIDEAAEKAMSSRRVRRQRAEKRGAEKRAAESDLEGSEKAQKKADGAVASQSRLQQELAPSDDPQAILQRVKAGLEELQREHQRVMSQNFAFRNQLDSEFWQRYQPEFQAMLQPTISSASSSERYDSRHRNERAEGLPHLREKLGDVLTVLDRMKKQWQIFQQQGNFGQS